MDKTQALFRSIPLRSSSKGTFGSIAEGGASVSYIGQFDKKFNTHFCGISYAVVLVTM